MLNNLRETRSGDIILLTLGSEAPLLETKRGIARMKLAPKDEWIIEHDPENDIVYAGIYEHPHGCLWFESIPTSELPNDEISVDDLERFGIHIYKAS